MTVLYAVRPKKTLFIKNLPTNTTEDEVKALSTDIVEVRLEATKNNGDKKTKYVSMLFSEFSINGKGCRGDKLCQEGHVFGSFGRVRPAQSVGKFGHF